MAFFLPQIGRAYSKCPGGEDRETAGYDGFFCLHGSRWIFLSVVECVLGTSALHIHLA